MAASLENSVVAILGPTGGVVGTGFVAADGLILTCGHVVSAAGSGPGQSVEIQFYRRGEKYSVPVSAEMWSPKDEGDVAVLVWAGQLPGGVKPVELGDAAGSVDHTFSAFGFAPISKAQWLRATGDIKALLTTPDGQSILQLNSQEPDHGMSGAPVLDEARGVVVGMISGGIDSSRLVKNRDTVFAVPTETLRHVCAPLGMPKLWPLGHSFATSPHFTGRADERNELSAWLNTGPTVLVLRALGGFGKSALAWHWLINDVDKTRWPRAVWWSFYDTPVFESFLTETLPHFDIDPRNLGPRQQADKLLEQLAHSGTLLVLDGFERALRAFSGMNAAYQGDEVVPQPNEHDCVSPIAEHLLRGAASRSGLRGRMLITTRLRPRVLETPIGPLANCRERELTELSPADAYALFHSLNVIGTRAEIEAACAPYGYHPLSLSLLAGLILNDPRTPGDIAVAGRLDLTGDLIQRQHHVLQQAYDSLTPARKQLLSRLACFRSPMTYEATAAIAELTPQPLPQSPISNLQSLDSDLRDLIARGLLHHDRPSNKYDLHPIVRRYAYDRLTDKTAAHTRLRDYFAAVEAPTKFKTLDELAPLIELYHHTVRAGQYDEAYKLFRARIDTPTYYQFGAYQLQIELLRALFPEGEDQPPRLKDESAQASALNDLAAVYSFSGQPRRAVPLLERSNALDEKRGYKKGVAIGLANLAHIAQLHIGALRAAEANLRRSTALCREIEDEFDEAIGHQELGHLLAYRSVWEESARELAAALSLVEKQEEVQSQGVVWAYRALRALLMGRAKAHSSPSPQPSPSGRGSEASPLPAGDMSPGAKRSGEGAGGEGEIALSSARRALELADEWQKQVGRPNARDYVRAHWLLGAAHRVNGDYAGAERHLTESLTRCRGINNVEHEADILIDLARLRAATNEPDEAARLAQEALEIAERCSYALQGADAHLELAKLALAKGDRQAALAHAREARRLATCDGPPDYTYKVAYEEAGKLLEQLGGVNG